MIQIDRKTLIPRLKSEFGTVQMTATQDTQCMGVILKKGAGFIGVHNGDISTWEGKSRAFKLCYDCVIQHTSGRSIV